MCPRPTKIPSNSMKIFIFTALFTCLSLGVQADSAPQKFTDTNLYGHVVAIGTHEHIAYATLSVKGTTIGTTTNASGHYMLENLPVGTHEIEVQLLGYTSQTKTVTLTEGRTCELNFEIEECRITLDNVVISANRNASLRREAPALVSVLDADLFEKVNANCLAQGLSFQPGVRTENDCQNCGFTQVRINGLDGHYSQILVDSHPIFSALTGVYGLEQIPANMIDRVEVVRGGGSALCGSAAIGGTINIITKDPLRNTAQLAHTLLSLGGSSSYDNSTVLNASLVTDDGKAGVYLYGQSRHRSAYDHNGDGFTELPLLTNQTVGTRAFIRTGAYSRLTAQYHHIGEFRRGGDQLNRPPHQTLITEQTDHAIDGGSLSFDHSSADRAHRLNLYASFQNTARKSYYGSGEDPNAYGTTHDITVATGAQYLHAFRRLWFMPAELTLGAEYSYDGLQDESLGYGIHTNQDVHIISGYLQNEWKTKRWSLLIGGRLDKHNLLRKPIFSPRANVRFNPSDAVSLRLSYAGGFRAPQAFDEDTHISIVGGERVRIRLAEGLREERSHSFSLSSDLYSRIGNTQVNLLVEGFCTLLDDVFALRPLTDKSEDGSVIKERYNGSGATVVGLNIEGKLAPAAWCSVQTGWTYQRSRYTHPEQWSENPKVAAESRMFRTPDLYGYFTLTCDPVRRLSAALTGTYTGQMLVQHMVGSGTSVDTAVETPSFCDMNLKITYTLPLYKQISMQLHGGMQNIFNAYQRDFDRGQTRDSGYIYGPSLPRSWFVGLKLSF